MAQTNPLAAEASSLAVLAPPPGIKLETSVQDLVKEGRLSKWVNLMQGWQHRYFVLDGKLGILSYYTSRDKMRRNQRRGCIRLKHAIAGIETEDSGSFTIKTGDKTFYLMAQSTRERDEWIHALEEVIRFQNTLSFNLPFVPDFDAFETNLRNTDTLMEMMIDQVRDLRKRYELVQDELEKQRLQGLISSSSDFIESLKHCIIMLQIAKNEFLAFRYKHATLFPQNKCQIRLAREGYEERIGFDLTRMDVDKPQDARRLPEASSSVHRIEQGEECFEESSDFSHRDHSGRKIGGSGDSLRSLDVVEHHATRDGNVVVRHVRSGVPPESYSSEEEFYDAEESLDDEADGGKR